MFKMKFEKLNNKMCKTISTMALTSDRIFFQNRACVTADFRVVYVTLFCDTCSSFL